MSGLVKIGLRLVRTTKYILNNNTKKYVRSMCDMGDDFYTEHVIVIASRQSRYSSPIKPAGYWKKRNTVAIKTLKYSFISLTIFVAWVAYKIQKHFQLKAYIKVIMAADGKSQKYSILPSKIISSSVFLSDGLIEMKTRDDSLTLENDNTRNLILNEELDANLEEPFPRGEPVPIKIGRVDGLLDNGKLTLKTEDGDTTFTFHHTLSLEVEKTSTTLQNEVKEKQQPGITLKKNGRFNYIYSGSKTTLKTPTSEKESTAIKVDYQLNPDDGTGLKALLDKDSTPLIGNFSVLSDATIKIQANKSDEVYYFKHSVNIECDKKLDGNLDNKIVAGKENPKNKIIPEEVILDSGTVVFQTQDGKRFAARQMLQVKISEDGEKTYVNLRPHLAAIASHH